MKKTDKRVQNPHIVKHWICHSIKEALKKLPKRVQSEYLENNPPPLNNAAKNQKEH